MTDLLEYIKKMQEMYGEDVITTADKINRPDPKPIVKEIEIFNEFNRRNPQADGGRIGLSEGTRKKLTKEQLEEMLKVEPPKNYKDSPLAIPDDWLKRLKEKFSKADGGQLVAPSVDGSRPGYQGKEYAPGYTIKERTANKIKYEKVLTEMLSEIDVMKEKGYGNVSSLVEKYSDQLGLTKNKVKKYYDADGESL